MLDILSDEWFILSNLVLDSARASTRRRLLPSELAALVIFAFGIQLTYGSLHLGRMTIHTMTASLTSRLSF